MNELQCFDIAERENGREREKTDIREVKIVATDNHIGAVGELNWRQN